MGGRSRRIIGAGVLGLVLAACTATVAPSSNTPTDAASDPPSPTPATHPSPSASPAVSPSAATPVAQHTMTCMYAEPASCEIQGLDEHGDVLDGWPVTLAGECHDLVPRGDGSAAVVCDGAQVGVVHVLLADGTAAPGWPVELPHRSALVSSNTFGISCGEPVPAVAVRADGTVIVGSAGDGAAQLHAFQPDGAVLSGWPQPFPGDAPVEDWGDGCRGFTLGPGGSVVAWGYEDEVPDVYLVAGRTVFTVLDADGTVRPGWPRGSVGATSGPIVGDDGSLSYVTAAGNAWRHDASGEPVDGWPFALGDPLRPYPAGDGRLAFIREGESPEAIVIGADGDLVAGWPVTFDRTIQTRCLFGDTPCIGSVDPVFAPDGTMFASLGTADWVGSAGDGTLVGLDPGGGTVPGWPVPLGDLGHAVDLSIDTHGRLEVDVVACAPDGGECSTDWQHSTLVFETDGTLAETRPGGPADYVVQSPE